MFPDSNIQPIKWIVKNWVSLILHRSISWQQARSFPPRSRDSGSRVQKNVRCIRGYYVEKNGRIGSRRVGEKAENVDLGGGGDIAILTKKEGISKGFNGRSGKKGENVRWRANLATARYFDICRKRDKKAEPYLKSERRPRSRAHCLGINRSRDKGTFTGETRVLPNDNNCSRSVHDSPANER